MKRSVVPVVGAFFLLALGASHARAMCPLVSAVQFNQIDWFGTNAPPIDASEWGEFSAVIAPTPDVEFVNVLANAGTGDQWVVRNLPTLPASVEPASQRIATVFDLGLLGITRGTPLTTVSYLMTVDSTPRTTPPPSGPMETVTVGSVRDDAQGRGEETLRDPGSPPDLSSIDLSIGPFGLRWHLGVPNIDLNSPADELGCGPAAAANSLKWLGVEGALRDIYRDMNTATGRAPGGAISDDEFLNGKLAANFDKNLGLTTKFQDDELGGRDYSDPDNPEYGTAIAKGTTPTFDFVADELAAHEDVELGMSFYRCTHCVTDGDGDGAVDIDAGNKCRADAECAAIAPGDGLGKCDTDAPAPECVTDADCDAGTSACRYSGGHWVTVVGSLNLPRGVWTKDDAEQTTPGGTRRRFGRLLFRPDGFLELAGFARNKVDIVVSESPTTPPSGEQCANWEDDDGNHLVDCEDPQCQCPPIGKDPGRIRFATGQFAGDAHDQIRVHGTVAPLTPLDPPNEEVGYILTNAAGLIHRAAVAPGAMVAQGTRGQHFVYRDRIASQTRCGIAKIDIRFRPAKNHYRVRVIAYGDLSAATDPNMTLQLKIGDDGFVNGGPWERTKTGWMLTLPGEG